MVRQHAEIDAVRSFYESGEKSRFCSNTLRSDARLSIQMDGRTRSELRSCPSPSKLVVEYDFPALDIIPELAAYRSSEQRKIVTSRRSEADRKRLYASVVAQASLRVLYVLFNADYAGHIESVAFNGHVHAINRGTGHEEHPCLLTLRTTRALFSSLDLACLEPGKRLFRGLNAELSKKPADLVPVRPVLEFNMTDPRFVQEDEVLAGLDNRTNLMALSPKAFEMLIANLFTKMGLETRQTRPSRDGGVDCVAYDPRPIFGGKVVIQAKRYKNTVGVSAVRDLYGTLQNEGASKGILITTSGYGGASFEFANGKPIELLNGSNLLYLLHENAGIEAKIEVPQEWKEPNPDSGE